MSRRARRWAIAAVTSISLLVGIDEEVGNVLGTSGSREAPIESGHETLREEAGSLAGSESDPYSRIRQALAAREYEASPGANGLQAPNRRHDLRTFFTAMGVEVHDRTAAGSPRLLSLSLAGVGRGEGPLAPVEAGTTTSVGNRVEIARPGLVEWYENSDAGLEQGFTFAKRPEGASVTGQRGGASAGEMLVLELAIDHARASLWGDRVLLATQTGRQLAYDKLVVTDADGVQIPSRIEVPEPDRIRLVVADAGARYPIVIDPILTETSDATFESGQTNVPLFMQAAGDVNGDGYGDVIVGSSGYDTGSNGIGAAFIAHGSADGITSQAMSMAVTRLDASGASESNFGSDVASAGDVDGDGYDDVIVTAATFTNGQLYEGGAFVFHGGPTGVPNGGIATAATTIESNQALPLGIDGFVVRARGAGDVDGDGFDDVIVGFSEYTGTVSEEGGAFLFHGSPTGIPSGNPSSAATRLTSGQTGSEFGWRVDSAGDVNGDGYDDVIVGAYRHSGQGLGPAGSAFVFHGSANGVADATPATAATEIFSDVPDAWLGWHVAGAGDVNGDGYADVIIGAPRYDVAGANRGAAFVLHGGPGGVPDLLFPSGSPTVLTGASVSGLLGYGVAGVGDIDGDGYADVMVGEPGATGSAPFDGAAHLFRGGAGGIPSGGIAVADVSLAGSGGESLGASVAGAGDIDGDGFADVLVATLPNLDQLLGGPPPVPPESNVVHLYRGGARLPDANPTSANTRLESNQLGAEFGRSVAVGDVNGDGLGDVVVGARRYDGGQIDEGAVFVFHGTLNGIADADISLAPTRIESNQVSALLGTSVAVGDVNGDGVEDILVGAPSYDAGQSKEGALFVFHGVRFAGLGSRSLLDANAIFQSDQDSALLGDGVGFAGDVDGDGFGDVVVAARDYDAGQTNEGAVFVLHGSAAGIAATNPSDADTTIESDQGSSNFDAVAGAGDVDGDGFADIVVGAQSYDAGESNEGAAFVFHGSVSGIASGGAAAVADTLIQGNQSLAEIGEQVASAGDVNGDGFSDLIVSSTSYHGAVLGSGAAFVFHGRTGGIVSGGVTTATSRLEGDQASARFGSSVASAGDVDGDGHGDVVVGAEAYDLTETNEGAAFVFLGGGAGVASKTPATAHAVFTGGAPSTLAGRAIAAGDIDGDGRSDLVFGAYLFDGGEQNEGGVFVVLGNGRSGRDVALRASPIADPTTTLQPWQLASGGLDVSLHATHPQGRGRAKLEVEWCATGVPFGDPACDTRISSSWTDVGSTAEGIALSETIATASPPGLYRWRARMLRAAMGVTQPGVVSPPNPSHGPWLRPTAMARESDVRVPEPLLAPGLLTGLGWISILARRQERARRRGEVPGSHGLAVPACPATASRLRGTGVGDGPGLVDKPISKIGASVMRPVSHTGGSMQSFLARHSRFAALLASLVLLSCGDGSSSSGGQDGGQGVTSEPNNLISGTIGPAGGTLQTSADDGTRYTLTIPANAIPTALTIAMTPITAIGGYPLAGGVVGGVQLEPSGTVFTDPATLMIETPATPAAGSVPVAILYSGDGTSFEPSFAGSSGATFTVPITHFSGATVGFATAPELAELAGSGGAPCLIPAIAAADASDLTTLFAVYRSCFQSDVLPALEGSTNDVQLATAIGQFTMWRVHSRDVLRAELFAAFDDVAETTQYFDVLVGKLQEAVIRNNQRCQDQQSIASLVTVLFWQAQGARFGLNSVANLLDRGTILRDLCARMVVDQAVIPNDLSVGFPYSLDVTFGLLFNGAVESQGVPTSVLLTGGDNVDIQNPDGFTNAQGLYTSVITATSDGGLLVTANGCLVSPGTTLSTDVCVEETVESESIDLTGSWTGNVFVAGLPACAEITQFQNGVSGTIISAFGTHHLVATISGRELTNVSISDINLDILRGDDPRPPFPVCQGSEGTGAYTEVGLGLVVQCPDGSGGTGDFGFALSRGGICPFN